MLTSTLFFVALESACRRLSQTRGKEGGVTGDEYYSALKRKAAWKSSKLNRQGRALHYPPFPVSSETVALVETGQWYYWAELEALSPQDSL